MGQLFSRAQFPISNRRRNLSHSEAALVYWKTTVAVTTRFTNVLDENCVRSMHPHMNFVIVPDFQSPSTLTFESRPDVASEVIVQSKSNETDWEAIVEREINTPFAVGGKGTLAWRLVIVQPVNPGAGLGTDLVWSYSHAVADGVSGMIMFKDLMASYEAIKKQQTLPPRPMPLQLAPLHPTVQLIPFSVFSKLFVWLFWPIIKAKFVRPLKLPTVQTQLPRHSTPIFARSSEAALARIQAQCKQAGVTVGSLLNALICVVIARQYQKQGNVRSPSSSAYLIATTMRDSTPRLPKTWDNVCLSPAANLRPRLSPPRGFTDIGEMMTVYEISMDLRPAMSVLELARQVQVRTHKALSPGMLPLFVHIFEMMAQLKHRAFWATPPNGRLDDFATSNVGACIFPQKTDSYHLKEMFTVNSLDEIGPLQLAFMNSTSRICVAWYYDAGLTPESSAREMLAMFMSLLESEYVMQRSLGQLVVPALAE